MVSGSQKGFMLPPGLAFVSVSEKAWKRNEKSKMPRFYFNLKKKKERILPRIKPTLHLPYLLLSDSTRH